MRTSAWGKQSRLCGGQKGIRRTGDGVGSAEHVVKSPVAWFLRMGVRFSAVNARLSDRIRPAAVAGTFYPGRPDRLTAAIQQYLSAAPLIVDPQVPIRGLVVPHAGYPYSGPVAGVAYKQIAGRKYATVVLLGPSHYAYFEGAAIPDVDAFQTPLGEVPLSNKAAILAQHPPFAFDPPARVRPPGGWGAYASGATPHTYEHSLEVQLPFLQTVLSDFEIVPIVFGKVDPREAAEALATILDDQTLLVVSTDLSHYQPYRLACDVDRRTLDAIVRFDFDYLEGLRYEPELSPCGSTGVLVALHLARAYHWKPVLLDYRNSGDTSGDKSAVVGYGAMAFCGGVAPRGPEVEENTEETEPDASPQQDTEIAGEGTAEAPSGGLAHLPNLTAEEKRFLLDLAWATLRRFVQDGRLPVVDSKAVPTRLREPWACFVTLRRRGALRGCIGTLTADQPLYLAVMENARNAARDPRFLPLEDWELADLTVEISVLSPPQPLEYRSPEELLQKLRPGVDGVIFQWRGARATFLPQVWEELPDPEEFLDRLCQKAGLPSKTWRQPDAKIWVYQVEKFGEVAHGAG